MTDPTTVDTGRHPLRAMGWFGYVQLAIPVALDLFRAGALAAVVTRNSRSPGTAPKLLWMVVLFCLVAWPAILGIGSVRWPLLGLAAAVISTVPLLAITLLDYLPRASLYLLSATRGSDNERVRKWRIPLACVMVFVPAGLLLTPQGYLVKVSVSIAFVCLAAAAIRWMTGCRRLIRLVVVSSIPVGLYLLALSAPSLMCPSASVGQEACVDGPLGNPPAAVTLVFAAIILLVAVASARIGTRGRRGNM